MLCLFHFELNMILDCLQITEFYFLFTFYTVCQLFGNRVVVLSMTNGLFVLTLSSYLEILEVL